MFQLLVPKYQGSRLPFTAAVGFFPETQQVHVMLAVAKVQVWSVQTFAAKIHNRSDQAVRVT